ncbi:serine O-acetyltransferase [Bacteroides ovatus]|uniref:serine O-acetyltransferase n=1 Tax=Bacteroides ovatus TaxID=28116 RepID=UPI00233E6493|nr:serine O-acetyltransferase [Bacteroides ovatus]MDC2625262.1 serine O-acetyltransferase [Bacteroides ovatus]MDC2639164.1 serine O-acetyltransferase [Bacteroides ovatus]MDC2653341.1 serine O-acetyltransferase [Bacteroides ovatus]
MHSIDIYHAVNLPDVFFLEHPVGSVFGRAEYGTNFFAMQNCTVGGNRDRKTGELFYPVIGDNVKMYSGSKIIGKSKIGNNVTLAANTYVKDIEIPDGATVFGQSPNLVVKFLK